MKATIHFKLDYFAKTACGKKLGQGKNINWNEINCTECLMLRNHLKNMRK